MSTELDSIQLCRFYSQKRADADFYTTSIFASMVTIFGVLGNAATLLTLSERRLTTATFVYYRTIAEVDLCRCIFVFTYVFRVLIPFRNYYWLTCYEAHIMYFAISTLGFISTSLAVFLCFRLCIGIVKSTRLKKTQSDPRETRKVIYFVLLFALLINVWLCFEYEVVEVNEDACSMDILDQVSVLPNSDMMANQSDWRAKKFSLTPSEFSFRYSILLKAIHNIPTVILLILLAGTMCLLVLCVLTLPGLAKHTGHSILTADNAALHRSKPWRTQRQLCKLFIFLSISYGSGLLPSLLHYIAFGTDAESMTDQGQSMSSNYSIPFSNVTTVSSSNGGVNTESLNSYEQQLINVNKRHLFATIMNVVQNFAHALSFYVYATCSEAFRNEFRLKIRRASDKLISLLPWRLKRPQLGSVARVLIRKDGKLLREPRSNDMLALNCNELRRKHRSEVVFRKTLLSEHDTDDFEPRLAVTVV